MAQRDKTGPKTYPSTSVETPRQRWGVLAGAVLIVADGAAAFSNSFDGVFLFDDVPSIVTNQALRGPGAILRAFVPPEATTQHGRPVPNITLAINYALGGTDIRGYHAFNLAVHLLAGLTLLGIVRRTLLLPVMRQRFAKAATWLATAASLLWVVHPLQSESVTYIVQRTESLMGLFYLLTLYCFIRGATSSRAGMWTVAAVAACAAGMGSKEVMATAPLMVLLYDVVFVSSSPVAAWKARRGLYVGLAASWAILAVLVISTGSRSGTAGVNLSEVSPLEYAASEFGVILHYLSLAFWPVGLCLDYGWPVARSQGEILPAAAVIVSLLAATLWALTSSQRFTAGSTPLPTLAGRSYRAAWGFLGAWFFLILAPTSSFMPLADLCFEHRMYLPLAAMATGLTIAGYLLAGDVARRWNQSFAARSAAWGVAGLAVAVSATLLGWRTHVRNLDYRSNRAMYEDAAAKRPNHARAQSNLGFVLVDAGQADRALAACNRAIELVPNFPEAYNNRGRALAAKGQYQQAIADYDRTIKMQPDHAEAHSNRGAAKVALGRLEEAMADYDRAIKLNPQYGDAYNNRAILWTRRGQYSRAIDDATRAIELSAGGLAEAFAVRAEAYAQQGRHSLAVADYTRAVGLKPTLAEAYAGLGASRHKTGKIEDSVADYTSAIQLQPTNAATYNNRGYAYSDLGRFGEALADFAKAIDLDPNDANTYDSRALAYYRMGRFEDAWRDIAACRRLGGTPDAKLLEDLVKVTGQKK